MQVRKDDTPPTKVSRGKKDAKYNGAVELYKSMIVGECFDVVTKTERTYYMAVFRREKGGKIFTSKATDKGFTIWRLS